jgi:hypothetical protein
MLIQEENTGENTVTARHLCKSLGVKGLNDRRALNLLWLLDNEVCHYYPFEVSLITYPAI